MLQTKIQIGGGHYLNKKIQPVEYIQANDLSFFQGNVVKYVTRYKDKKGSEDLKKAIHYLQMILEFEYDVLTNFSYLDENIEEVTEFQTKEDFFGHGKEIAKELDAKDISQEQLKVYVDSVRQEKKKLWCETCEGVGHYDNRDFGIPREYYNSECPCPDCDGKGYIEV